MDSIILHVEANDPNTHTKRLEIARQVRDYFVSNLQVPSHARALCYLDDRDVDWLKERWGGGSNRGGHWPIRGQGLHDWPRDMWYTLSCSNPDAQEIDWPYDSIVYLHGSTCSVDVQLAMTLAHELQHFLQFANHKQIWAIGVLLSNLPYLPTPDLCHWYDLPTEREARIIGKRVAVDIFGRSSVDQHIALMAQRTSSQEDAADWDFIAALDSDESYDPRAGTIPFVQRHRKILEEMQRTTFAHDKDIATVLLEI